MTPEPPATIALDSDTYKDEYEPPFVEKWDELIGWEGRAEGEGTFFSDLLREAGCERVLDAAAGTGFHAVNLARAGFDVVAADGAATMLRKTEQNMREHGVDFPTYHADWRSLQEDVPGRFDALVCLGNAFTHLFDVDDRARTLSQFHQVLEPGGIAIIDQRNYDAILDNGYSSKHRYYYTGNEVDAAPELITDEFVRFRYAFPDGAVHHLTLYPVRADELTSLLLDVGFSDVERYGDFQPDYVSDDVDFIVQVARR